jgi:cold shock protein
LQYDLSVQVQTRLNTPLNQAEKILFNKKNVAATFLWSRLNSDALKPKNKKVPERFLQILFTMQLGMVKWFNKTKGIGFITPMIGGNDIRVYAQDLTNHSFLQEGQRVQFTVEISPNVFIARQVIVIPT